MLVVRTFALVAVMVLVNLPLHVEAAVINAASCSRANVGTAVAAASDGDTVQLPAGTCSWTSTLSVTKAITVAGAGIDQTILVDDVVLDVGGNGAVLDFDTVAGKNWRLTGITIRYGSRTDKANNGSLTVHGGSKAWRIDHLKMDDVYAYAQLKISGDTWGLIDHSTFYTTRFVNGVSIVHNTWGGVGANGDNSWATAANLGSVQAVYVEDSTFTNAGHTLALGMVEAAGGGRYVARYNTFTDSSIQNHGTETSGRFRSGRYIEAYNNVFTFSANDGNWALDLRGGTGVVFNNTITGLQNVVYAHNDRDNVSYAPWGKCDGTSSYDQNTSSQTGYACIDQVGRGVGGLLANDSPTPAVWPNQASEPFYVWGNAITNPGGRTPATINAPDRHVQVGRDIIDNGTTAKPGYTPFTYPHPLAGVLGAPSSFNLK